MIDEDTLCGKYLMIDEDTLCGKYLMIDADPLCGIIDEMGGNK